MAGASVQDDYVPGNPVHNASRRLVVISGCSGGGKSTLLDEMARRGYPVFPEPGRQIVREQQFIGGNALPWSNPQRFLELCLSRAMYFYNSARPVGRPALFDRSLVDAVAGLERMGQSDPEFLAGILERYRYARTVFMAPPWEALFESDAERKHAFADAVREYDALAERYPQLGYDVQTLPKTSVAERADFLEARIF